jgi:hypothetical protein
MGVCIGGVSIGLKGHKGTSREVEMLCILFWVMITEAYKFVKAY